MKLRTKFMVGALVLLVLYALLMFFIPGYLIRKDVKVVADKIHNIETEQDQENLNNQKILISDIFQQQLQNINSFLFMVYEMPHLQEALTFPSSSLSKEKQAESLRGIWRMLAHLASYNPSYGFLQLDSLDGRQTAALVPEEANMYAVQADLLDDQLVMAVTLKEKNARYLGIPFQGSENMVNQYLILFPWTEDAQQIQAFFKQAEQISTNFQIPKALDEAQVFEDASIENEQALNWANKLKMLQTLLLFVFDPQASEPRQIPSGIVLLQQNAPPRAILTEEAVYTVPLAPARDFYAVHQPPPSAPPLGNDKLLISSEQLQHIFLANTMKTDAFYLTLGVPIDPLAEQLAIWTKKTILVRVGDKLWMGFSRQGDRYSSGQIRQLDQDVQQTGSNIFLQLQDNSGYLVKQQNGTITIEGKQYIFSNILNLRNGEIGFYQLSDPTSQTLAQYTLKEGQTLSQEIFLQIYFASLLIIACIFMAIACLATINAIRPVRALALATESIIIGDYTTIHLPNMGKRKDEMAVLVGSFEKMIRSLQEKEKIRAVLNKVVSKDIAEEILKSDIQLGGEDRYLTVLFADIRNFTSMTRDMTPQQTIEMLNTVMTKLTQIIEGEGGVVDKYVGDEVMAVFGAPQKNEKHALHAVSAGVLMVKTMIKWNEERVAKGDAPIRIGVGIHSGIVVAGNMGASDRLNYTVLGTNVNLAARLCQAAAPKQVLISSQTLQEPGVQNAFDVKALPSIEVKGFDHPVSIYEASGFKWHDASGENDFSAPV
ncbi:MAG: hypothetical protein JSS62_04350 [Verrucomicrobia bacterium]|nr:hypothetical protein [Verrucomicrobiota bacterium]MBS0646276.1 hypothetical protein [Verrucomicrobiota bacterium]